MIPLKLTVRNFLCYREDVPTLDLEGIRVACLCGPNGFGKSALLDAITWALWGKARGIPNPARGRTQDELIHYGENEMLVELEFTAREARYRVIRRHVRGQPSRPGSSDLQLLVSAAEGFRPITGDSISETQERIEELVGLDYETFINSAFLLQGRADEFTTKAPDKRKEVLARVMGLELYDRLAERARGRASERVMKLKEVEGGLETLAREVEAREEVEAALRQVQVSLAVAQGRLKEAREGVDSLRRQVEGLQRSKSECQEAQERVPVLEEERKAVLEQTRHHQERIQTYEALLADRAAIESGFQRWRHLQALVEKLSAAQVRYSALLQEEERLRGQVRAEEARLSEEIRHLKRQVEELASRAGSLSRLEEELACVKVRLEELAAEEGSLGEGQRRLRELSARVGQVKGDLLRLEGEGRDLGTKLALLERTPLGARCPLCNSLLGQSEFQHILESHRRQIEEKRFSYLKASEELQRLEGEQKSLQKELTRREAAFRGEERKAQARMGSLERQREEARKAADELVEARARLQEVGRQVAEECFAPEARGQLAALKSEMASLGYDPQELEAARRAAEGTQPFEERYRSLQEAQERLPQERRAHTTARQTAQRLEEEVSSLRGKAGQLRKTAADLSRCEEELRNAEGLVRRLEGEERELMGREGEVAGRLKRILQYEGEMQSLRRTARRLGEEAGAYQELGQALGRRGVQAVLIESVLPELEREADQLLGRMTDNRMHLKLESLRELRSRRGEQVETLDIKISDELGTRNYEMYSGGEAFRVNLALRIALSRVLAQRRGAPLPTLFIDEGFGTQDAAGRERIIEVIGAIQPLFQKIIVVTHLEEVKEAFPVRIEVQKTEQGSTFTIT